MTVGDLIFAEPGFRDDKTVYSWRVEWDEEFFCHVEAIDAVEATQNAFALMNRTSIWITRTPVSVTIVQSWVVVAAPTK